MTLTRDILLTFIVSLLLGVVLRNVGIRVSNWHFWVVVLLTYLYGLIQYTYGLSQGKEEYEEHTASDGTIQS